MQLKLTLSINQRINLKKGVVVYGSTNSPENTVFVHGRTNKPIIDLPEEWGEIVNWKSVSVQVTPYGLQQNLIVRRVDKEKLEVHVQVKDVQPWTIST